MQVTARIKNLKISPKKVRLIAGLVRGKKATVAIDQLRFANKKSSMPIADLIKSAVANGENSYKLDPENLYVKSITVDKGLTIKRFTPRAFGRATMIRKKMSHVALVLDEIIASKEHAPKKTKKSDVIAISGRDKIKEIEEPKKEDIHNTKIPVDAEVEKGKEIKDPRMEGGHRANAHMDTKSKKAAGGVKQKSTQPRKTG